MEVVRAYSIVHHVDMDDIYEVLVVGAGMSGLCFAVEAEKVFPQKVIVLEKSKGVGGRVATRRQGLSIFDHGAQFYRLSDEIQEQHLLWLQSAEVTRWPELADSSKRYASRRGMTSIAKTLQKLTDVQLDSKVVNLQHDGQHWLVTNEKQQIYRTKRLVLSAPLPQALDLVKSFIQPSLAHEFAEIAYAQAIVALVEQSHLDEKLDQSYRENVTDLIYSVSAQHAKIHQGVKSYTIVFNPEISQTWFPLSDDEIQLHVFKHLLQLDPELVMSQITIKKWRYSHPLKKYRTDFCRAENELYFIGDAFGGGSVSGALRSALALAKAI